MRDGLDGTEWSQRSKVKGRRSKVEGQRSKVEGQSGVRFDEPFLEIIFGGENERWLGRNGVESKVKGQRSKVEGRRSKVEGRK